MILKQTKKEKNLSRVNEKDEEEKQESDRNLGN